MQASATPGRRTCLTERLDRSFTHPVHGLSCSSAVMCGLFWTLFTLASVPMDLIEALFGSSATIGERTLPAGPVRDLLAQGIIGGLSGTSCSCRRSACCSS